MSVYDVLVSLWRTAVPAIAGWVAALLAHLYIHVDDQALSQGLVAVFAVVYYAVFRLLEAKVSPSFGWLLGLAKPPAYPQQPPRPGADTSAAGPRDYPSKFPRL